MPAPWDSIQNLQMPVKSWGHMKVLGCSRSGPSPREPAGIYEHPPRPQLLANLTHRPTEMSWSPTQRDQLSEHCFPTCSHTIPPSYKAQKVLLAALLVSVKNNTEWHKATRNSVRLSNTIFYFSQWHCRYLKNDITTCKTEYLYSLHTCRLPGPDMDQRTTCSTQTA